MRPRITRALVGALLALVVAAFSLVDRPRPLQTTLAPDAFDGPRAFSTLQRLAGRFPDDLSGGEQQRVAIARALVGERRLVLADEPTGALDSVTGESVLALLRARVDAGAAAVLVTHEARLAGWADRVVFLRDGRVVDEARAEVAV